MSLGRVYIVDDDEMDLIAGQLSEEFDCELLDMVEFDDYGDPFISFDEVELVEILSERLYYAKQLLRSSSAYQKEVENWDYET